MDQTEEDHKEAKVWDSVCTKIMSSDVVWGYRAIAMKFRVVRYKINGQCRHGVCNMCTQCTCARRVWGHAPPGKFGF